MFKIGLFYDIISQRRKRCQNMSDIVNERVDEAQRELMLRAKKLEALVKGAKGKQVSAGFKEGVNLAMKMIEGQAELYDKLIFDAPKTALEQQRNLMLLTGSMDQSVKDGIKTTTEAIDSMIDSLKARIR